VVARFDLAWLDVRIAAEFESYKHHYGRQAWRRAQGRSRLRARTQWNPVAGDLWLVLDFTDDDLARGPSACDHLVRASRARKYA
jgi:hypothetical protein